MAWEPPPPPRNLVVCCDGTSNEIGINSTNVLKTYRVARKTSDQRVFYDPGVGTIGRLATWGRLSQKAGEVIGLATGYGLDDNILDAYRWLAEQYRDGDRIFLFGFSRGAYTVRALAGLINMIGLPEPDQINITDYALTAYKRAAEQDNLPLAWQFGRISGARDVSIHFLGVWDTVASVIVPRSDRFFVPSLQFLPYTKQNNRVRCFRQALAIDERRRMFRHYRWNEGQTFKPHRFSTADAIAQDAKQVWFAGVHADVGGGYAEEEAGLSKFPLMWMLQEAKQQGLIVDEQLLDHLARGAKHEEGRLTYSAPDPIAPLHQSLHGPWWLLEVLPKRSKWRRWPGRKSFAGLYLPLAEPRFIPDGAFVHRSVCERIESVPNYRPKNLPKDFQLVADDEESSRAHSERDA